MDTLEARLKVLLRGAAEQKLSLEKVPPWLRGWESPWKGKSRGGELIIKGEDELYDLGIRIREKFPDMFNEEYHPDVYAIRATQVSCTLSFLSFNLVKLLSIEMFPQAFPMRLNVRNWWQVILSDALLSFLILELCSTNYFVGLRCQTGLG